MNVRSLILVAAALIIAVVTALLARSLMSGTSETPATAAASRKVAETKVLVAARSLPAGTILKTDDLKWQPWPEDAVTDILIREGSVPLGDMAGKVLRTALLAGQPVPQDAAVGPKERGFLAAVLSPGMRAITVSLSPTTGVGGFVFPGDRVDLVVTHEVERGDSRLEVAETVIRNVRVLAIDQSFRQNEKGEQVAIGKTATLELTPEQAKVLATAEALGSITLALRSLADSDEKAGPQVHSANKKENSSSVTVLRYGISSHVNSNP